VSLGMSISCEVFRARDKKRACHVNLALFHFSHSWEAINYQTASLRVLQTSLVKHVSLHV